MHDLATGKLHEDFFQNFWLQRLPLNIQAILLASQKNLPQFAVLFVKIHKIKPDSTQVYSVAKSKAVEAIDEPPFLTCKNKLIS